MVNPRNPRIPERNREHGFTLLELIVVVAIIGILATIAMPALRRVPDRARETVLKTNLRTLRDVIDHAARVPSSPIVTVNLWLDEAGELPGAFIGLVGGPMHWIFAKSQLFGGPVEHLSVVASGAVELLRQENAEVTAAAHAQISCAVPSLRQSRVRRAVVVREPRATFSLAPGAPPRPATRTALSGFFMAGDWTDTGLPGTIEGAVQRPFGTHSLRRTKGCSALAPSTSSQVRCSLFPQGVQMDCKSAALRTVEEASWNFPAAHSCIWRWVPPRCRRCPAWRGRKPIRPGRCASSSAFPPAEPPTSRRG
jgi:prepilin-type N-terminal cleavage/methylation domain-containing protein